MRPRKDERKQEHHPGAWGHFEGLPGGVRVGLVRFMQQIPLPRKRPPPGEETSSANAAVDSGQLARAEEEEAESCWRAAVGRAGLRLSRATQGVKNKASLRVLFRSIGRAPGISSGDAFSKTVDTVSGQAARRHRGPAWHVHRHPRYYI